MAKAMHDAAIDRVFRTLERKDLPDPKECVRVIKSLGSESDRAVPVVLFGYIDALVLRLLSAEIDASVPGGPAKLLKGYGPLASASSRIDVAHAMRWLPGVTAANLRLLRAVRNEFAHNPFITFEEPRIRDRIVANSVLAEVLGKSRTSSESPGVYVDDIGQEWVSTAEVPGLNVDKVRRTARLDFVFAGVFTLYPAVLQLYVAPVALRSGVHPSDVLTRTDEMPEPLKEFHDSFPDLVDAAFWQEAIAQGEVGRLG